MRVSFDEWCFDQLRNVSFLSNSDTKKQGAMLVKDNTIISTGSFDAYETKDKERIVGSGAIENVIARCAKNGISTNGAVLYCYAFPNDIACKLIAKAGISEVKYLKDAEAERNSLGKEECMRQNVKMTLFIKPT